MMILLQGAMDEEVDVFLDYFNIDEKKSIGGFDFYFSSYKGHKIIISKTQKGIINATMSTTIGVKEFAPDLVINQGCAGGHTEKAKKGCIIIGEKAVYINDFKSEQRAKGEGSNSLDWKPNPKRSYVVETTKSLLEIAKGIDKSKNVFVGTLGSGDLHSKEYDRIVYLNSLFGEDCEDMESVASLKVCKNFNVDRIALRVISNNDILLQDWDKSVCKKMQLFTIKLVDRIIEQNKF